MNNEMHLLEPKNGSTMIVHFTPGSSQAQRLDNTVGENDSGFRLTVAYHVVCNLDISLGPAASLVLSTRSTEVIDVINDRIVIYKSTEVENKRSVATEEYFTIYLFMQGSLLL